ncbi:MAG: hypothetical protein RLZ98_3413 [Pseudomonadota bacterium]|jgi:polysaccharide export outer membrane protein
MSPRLHWLVVLLSLSLAGCAHGPGWPIEASGLGGNVKDSGWSTRVVSAEVYEGPAPVSPAILGGPKAVADSDGPYLLDTGDELRVFIYGHPNLSRIYKVDHGGKISIPLVGNINARGLTTYGLERKIKGTLGARYIRDPQVSIDVFRNRPFFILGEVRNPGAFAYVNGMTVESAVAIAGGYSERASMERMRISRRINGLVETMEVPSDYVVMPGDTVYVFERFF